MTVELPSAADQLAAALSAPIPFFFAVLAAGLAIWGVLEWIYRAVAEKTKRLYELSKLETEHAQRTATNKEAELTATVDSLKQQISDLTARLEAEVKTAKDESYDRGLSDMARAVKQLDETTTRASVQLDELRQANNAVTESFKFWPSFVTPRGGTVTVYSTRPTVLNVGNRRDDDRRSE